MNEALQAIHNRFIALMKDQPDVWGAWYFGSAARGSSDPYSDLDVVFLLHGERFQDIAAQITRWLESCCDRVILCWPEGFNGEAIVNNGYLLELNGEIVVYDVFLLSSDHLDQGICRMHYADLRESSILFDREGHVQALTAAAPSGSPWREDTDRLISTYWYHAHLSAKYLLRGDFFKLEAVTRTLMDAHVSLLLTALDQTTWGGSANKLRFLPAEKQARLKRYGCVDDFPRMRASLLQCFRWFAEDAQAIAPRETAVAEAVLARWLDQTRALADG